MGSSRHSKCKLKRTKQRKYDDDSFENQIIFLPFISEPFSVFFFSIVEE